MLKVDWKQNLVLLVFSFIMVDILTGTTIAFVIGGILLVLLKVKTNKLLRNILALGVFASYWFKYGKIIDPEIGLNFLTSIIVLKILEKETVRDRYMIFFGLILLISAGSLFERTLTYVLFFSISFLLLIRDFYSYLGQKWRLRDLGYALMWVLPLTFVMFFFIPRLLNPIPLQQNAPTPGEIGYSSDVNISQIESLTSNTSPVFQVLVNRSLNQGELYWRGNTLSYNDGWNWNRMVQDSEDGEILLINKSGSQEVEQSFRLFNRSDYFFTLDIPRTITHGTKSMSLGPMRTMSQKRWEWVQRYQVISGQSSIEQTKLKEHYLQVPISKKLKEKISKAFPGKTVPEIQDSIRSHFLKERFSYSLSPGRSLSLTEFLEKKIGFCSHYASATALILRIKGIPTRLVSGYMGGSYNRFADFYLVSENDAHVWVEAHANGKWIRLDPTEWIAPDRVRLGGEAYVESIKKNALPGSNFFKLPKFVRDLKLWFGQWDFMFYQWLEQMDYHKQEAWFMKFNFKRQWLFSVLPLMMVSFMLIYFWFLSRKKVSIDESPYQDLWRLFYKKMNKRGVQLSRLSVSESEKMLVHLNEPVILEVWNELIGGSFRGNGLSFKTLKKKIGSL